MNAYVENTQIFSIVVGNDFGVASGYAFDQAVRVASHIPGSNIHVAHVTDGDAGDVRTKQLCGQLRLYIEEKVHALGGLDNHGLAVHVRCGHPARELAQLAKDVHADLIVVGTQKAPLLKQLFVGSVAERLLLAAPCPVFVAGPMPTARDDAHEPALDPACPACVQARQRRGGNAWWCARHAEHHARSHSYSFHRDVPFASHDSAVTPTGVD